MNFKELEAMHNSLLEKHPNPAPGAVVGFPVLEPCSLFDDDGAPVADHEVKKVTWRYEQSGWEVDNGAFNVRGPVRLSWSMFDIDNEIALSVSLALGGLNTVTVTRRMAEDIADEEGLDYLEGVALRDLALRLGGSLLRLMRKTNGIHDNES